MVKQDAYRKLMDDLARAKVEQSEARKIITDGERKLRAATVDVEVLTKRINRLEAKL